MAKKKLFDDIARQPSRFYRLPGDVMRDRRFDDAERLGILRAWLTAAEPPVSAQIEAAIEELEGRKLQASGHAAQ